MAATSRNDAERKQVTALFADVSGSMDLAEQQDPEEWRKIMQRFFSILADAVTQFEGTVDKFTGDGIMAAATARRRGMHWQLPPALLTLAQARAASGAPGVTEALDEATTIGESHGQKMILERIEAERAALTAA